MMWINMVDFDWGFWGQRLDFDWVNDRAGQQGEVHFLL
jgi:hypothetical protein